MGKKKKVELNPKRGEAMQYRRNKYAAPVGGLWLVIGAIGVVAIIVFCIQFTMSMLDTSTEKQKFEKVILPVVMFDPVPFEKATDMDPLVLLQSSLWSTLLGEKRDSYAFDALGYLVVPASDVDVTCARLFGQEVKLEHQTFSDFGYETTYAYNETEKAYHIPVTGQTGLYTPSVEQVVKKGDVFILTVGYIPPANAWTQGKAGETNGPKPDKRMLYELTKVKDHYQLTAIRDVPIESVGSNAAMLGLTGTESSSAPSSSSGAADGGESSSGAE